MYVPAIVGYVPDDVVRCLTAFLDACYIARRQDINSEALDALDAALYNFRQLHEVFRIPGVRPTGFSLPRQHALFHYRRQIEDFGAPGGLCSSITESRHITAVKKPWRRSNRYDALGQMLQVNQRLEKLAAMGSDFVSRGMLPAGHAGCKQISHIPKPSQQFSDSEDGDSGPVEKLDILEDVALARTRGTSISLIDKLISNSAKHASIHRILRAFQFTLVCQTFMKWHCSALQLGSVRASIISSPSTPRFLCFTLQSQDFMPQAIQVAHVECDGSAFVPHLHGEATSHVAIVHSLVKMRGRRLSPE